MNKMTEIILVPFAVIGCFIVWFWIVGWIMDNFKEAKDKNKRIELSSMAISLLALVIAIVSLIFTLVRK